jgi:hypothetical protein
MFYDLIFYLNLDLGMSNQLDIITIITSFYF